MVQIIGPGCRFGTIFSLIMSFSLTPMLASLILPEVKKKKNKLAQWLERMEEKQTDLYKICLPGFLKIRR